MATPPDVLVTLVEKYDGGNGPLSKSFQSLKPDDWGKLDERDYAALYAAYLATHSQSSLLGAQGIHEEPQTAALFGFLSSNRWHAAVLQSQLKKTPGKRSYWLHQTKNQESISGADFGIITDLGDDTVKIMLFQAKRPQRPGTFITLKMDQVTHPAQEPPPKGVSAWVQQQEIVRLKDRLNTDEYAYNDLCAWFDEDPDWCSGLVKSGPDSLFSANYRYTQLDAFLASCLRGWQKSLYAAPKWCFFTQWANGANQAPWSVSAIDVLSAPARYASPYESKTDFASLLAESLRPRPTKHGLIIDHDNLAEFTGSITSFLPNIVWGCVSDSQEQTQELIKACGIALENVCAPPLAPIVDRPQGLGLGF